MRGNATGTHPLLKDIRINASIERGSACRLIQALSPTLVTGLIYCFTAASRTPKQHIHSLKSHFLTILIDTEKKPSRIILHM